MKNKKREEIIIDGVNVAGCQCFENDKCLWCKKYYENNATPNCKEVKNCYYKQLQRLEQENKKLRGTDGNIHPDSAYYKIKKLEIENKELKEVKEQLKKWNDENLKRQDNMQLWIDLAEEQRRKYRSALEEVRELVEKSIKISYSLKVSSMLYDIKHKINEVLNEQNSK